MPPLPPLARRAARRIPPLARLADDRARWRSAASAAQEALKQSRGQLAEITAERDRLRVEADARIPVAVDAEVKQAFPAGHFYSPIPDLTDVRVRAAAIFDRSRPELPGIDLRVEDQLGLLPFFADLYKEMPFGDEPADGLRYGFVNNFFSYGDGLALYSVLRHFRPRCVVEVGSGWSSALTLDVNERFLDGAMECTFIEPYPDRLHSLLRPADHQRVTIVPQPLHQVDDTVFGQLRAGDLLFIDSTHVSRIGSDVNRLLLEVVPSLPAGVIVHVHDVFWPFEYPDEWVFEGRSWSESYLLRALLIGNTSLEILWFNAYLAHHHRDAVDQALPLWSRNPGGSIYLRTR